MHAIERAFAERFRRWQLSLPTDAVARRAPGHLFGGGWHIGYLWGAEGDDEYVEVLAQHRMTGDDHFRLFASGRVEELEAPGEFYAYGPNATAEEQAEAQRQYVERNRRIYDELRARGLLPPEGGNLPAHEINEFLRSGGSTDE